MSNKSRENTKDHNLQKKSVQTNYKDIQRKKKITTNKNKQKP